MTNKNLIAKCNYNNHFLEHHIVVQNRSNVFVVISQKCVFGDYVTAIL